MKKFSKILLSAFITASLISNSLPFSAAADDTSASQTPPAQGTDEPVELVGENIIFEYVSTVYNGKEQKPVIRVMSGNSLLAENTDFTVEYPKDCVNAGKKTVIIKGIGGYRGSFSATYIIEPLDCSEKNTGVDIKIAKCQYSGMPLTPEVTVTANGMTLEPGDFTLAFSDNTEVTASDKKAKCIVTFRGNYLGSRTVEFNIEKTPSKDFEIQLMVHRGERVVYDLTPLKPDGASFGTIKYYSWDFNLLEQPGIAFNELSFTVPATASNSTAIVIPVTNAPNCEDYNIVVYPAVTDKIIPTVVLKSADREYNGEPLSADEFSYNGSYAAVNDTVIGGTWEFRSEAPLLPCDKMPCVVIFTPTDPQYAAVDASIFITISRNKAEEFKLKPHRAELALGQKGQLVISGIPENYKGEITLSCSDELGVTEVFYNDITKREYEIDFPVRSGRYTFTAELSGDGLNLPASSQCSITVGDYVPPEDKPSDKTTTIEELTALISSAAVGDTVKAEGIRTIPSELVKAAAEKSLTLEVKLNNTYRWIVDTANLSDHGNLDLDISAAVIPAVLLDKVGGENLCSFNIYANNLGKGTKLCVSSDNKNTEQLFANLFLYSTTGELKFITCSPAASGGTAEIEIGMPGKYAVITDTETKMPGDLNNNCKIDLADILAMLKEFVDLPTEPKITGKYVKYDIDHDDHFKLSDILALMRIFVDS